MTRKRVPLGNFVTEYSVRNKNNEDIPVYSVTNSQGFCREYFGKEVASKDKTTYKIVPYGYFAYNPSRINVGSVDWQRCETQVIVSPLYNVFSVSDELDSQFLYYFLKSNIGRQMIRAKAAGSVRDNLKLDMLKEITIPESSLDDQRHCTATLDNLQYLIELRKKQLNELDNLIKARFVEMFDDPVSNPKGWNVEPLGKRCGIITGNTPSRSEPENYGKYIEWIKSDNINTPFTFITKAQECLSEAGFGKCRFVEAGSILMTCIAGSINCIGNVAVTDRRVAFNQQINAIVPEQDEVLYLYWLMRLSRPMIHRTINMALKGILSKSQLSEMAFPFPPITLQKQFAAFVEQTDKSKVVEAIYKANTLFITLNGGNRYDIRANEFKTDKSAGS